MSGNKIISFCTSDEAQILIQAKLDDDVIKLDEELLGSESSPYYVKQDDDSNSKP